MAVVDTVILVLLGTALVFAILELGLSAYVVSVVDYYHQSRFNFIVFSSIWTMLVTAFLLLFPMASKRKSSSYGWIVGTTLALNCLTMIFWLGGFAAFADLWLGDFLIGVLAAELAFAVLLW